MPNHSTRARVATLACLGVAALLTVASPHAQACGGFFCNRATDLFNLPVAQTAENVLFAMDRDASGQFKLEAHIQIFYTGPADKFSWVVPVDSAPVIDVGSNAVFRALLTATQPRFQLKWQDEGTCKESLLPPQSLPGGFADASASSPSVDSGLSSGVTVSFRGDVGPYDAAVIKSDNPTDATPLLVWLRTNLYDVTPEAERLIADYVQQEKHFVAIRLRSQVGVNEIQPLVMRFLGPGPCVPLKLTSIAAIRDLKINLWVLADQRVVPDNFLEIVVNEARIDWFKGGSNYEQLIKEAANEAGGNAFVTDYAGSTAVLRGTIPVPPPLLLTALRAAETPPAAIRSIVSFPLDGIMLNILRTHIPLPDVLAQMGVNETNFYNRLDLYWQSHQAAFKPFSATAFADDVEAKVVEPLRKAQAMIDGHIKITRLSTFISPEEMTLDPTFVRNPGLPDVSLDRIAVAHRMCGDRQYDRCQAPVRLALADGQSVWFQPVPQPDCYGQAGQYVRAQLDDMPASSVAFARSSDGDGLKKYDNAAVIQKALVAHNTLAERSPPDAGVDGAAATDSAAAQPTARAAGCSCDAVGGRSTQRLDELAGLFLVAAALTWRRCARSRRRRARDLKA